MSVAFFCTAASSFSPFGEGLTGFSKRLCLFVGLCSQAVQTLLLPLDFELGDGQVFFSAAAFTALYIRVPGVAHIVEEIVLQDTVRLLQDWLAVLCSAGFPASSSRAWMRPLLAPADLRGLLDAADQSCPFTAFRCGWEAQTRSSWAMTAAAH